MIRIPGGVRVWMATGHTDMRRGMQSLALTVQESLKRDEHLLAGLLFDDAGHRMVATHATKAGVRYRYYVSTPFLHGEAKTASAGSVFRVPAADIEDTVVKSLKEHLAVKRDGSTTSASPLGDRGALA